MKDGPLSECMYAGIPKRQIVDRVNGLRWQRSYHYMGMQTEILRTRLQQLTCILYEM